MVGDVNSCSEIHLAGLNGRVIDIPQNGYWARGATLLQPSCRGVSMLSGFTGPIRNHLRTITASRVKHSFYSRQKKKSEMNRYFQDGLREPLLTALRSEGTGTRQ